MYYEQNKDKFLELAKEYRSLEGNKEIIKKYNQKYRQDKKEKIQEHKKKPFVCECGCTIQWTEQARHKRNKKHLDLMEAKKAQQDTVEINI